MRPFLGVVIGDGPRRRVLGDAQQAAVGSHLEARLHGGDDLVGRLVVRVVEAREPVMDVIRPGIREDQLGVVRGLGHEPEADRRVRSAVVTGERPRLAELQGARHVHGQLSGRLLELQRLAPVAHHPGDGELLGVEHARVEPVAEGGQGDRGFPLERLPIQVQADRDPVVQRVVRAAPLGLKGLGGPVDLLGIGRDDERQNQGNGPDTPAHTRLPPVGRTVARVPCPSPSGAGRRSSSTLRSGRPSGARRGRGSRILPR